MQPNRIVSRTEWLEAQRTHLKNEKALTRMRDLVAAERRALPWVQVEKPYVFDAPEGKVSLGDLFGANDQLIVHHLMYHPDWEAACVGCTFQADHIDGPEQHLRHHGLSVVAVSRAPLPKLERYRERMRWRFRWVSSFGSDFNYDFGVSFAKDQVDAGRIDYNFGAITDDKRYISEELPGVSVFARDPAGAIFHTYSCYARGLDSLIGAHHYLDLTPLGRNEAGNPDWVRRHDEYEDADVDAACHASERQAGAA